jgi:mannose-1-phosphate guanylyltransferase
MDSRFAHAYAVILAGGSGTRFWPLSRRALPKQMLRLFGPQTLLEQTVQRLDGIIPPERIYVFTSRIIHRQVVRLLRGIPPRQIAAEPAQRNTAPAIGLAAHEVLRRDPEGLMVVLPSDHLIQKTGAFRKALRAACRWAAVEGRSVTLGIRPSRPETGYGYLRLGERASQGREKVFGVEKFTEKPKAATARRYLASGRYLWNAGMFIWRASTLVRNLERFQPTMARGLDRIAAAGGLRNRQAIEQWFPRLEGISIDYALMEKIPQVFAVAADIGWSDVGSWAAAYDLSRKDAHGNARPANSLALGAQGNMIVSAKKFVVVAGVRDLVIVESEDALLVSARDRCQNVAGAVRELERRGLRKLL